MDRKAIIRSRYKAGEATKEIASDLGVSRSTVYAALRGGGPVKGDRAAYRVIQARVTEKELAAFDKAISKYGESSRSSLLRRLMRMASDMPAPTPDDERYLTRFDHDLRALSGNFNQIARDLSASRQKLGEANPHKFQIDAMNEARHTVRKLRSAIRRIMLQAQVRNERHISMMGHEAD